VLYLKPWAGRTGFDVVLATELEFPDDRFFWPPSVAELLGDGKSTPTPAVARWSSAASTVRLSR
jgi:hypothetical protein